ncbi:MAG TPA: NAD(P)H-binding protein [Acidimicrobiales bacterium]|nr:NAD(P)H-binding protein [Acidimicrobiales bacterium]
MRILVIGGTGLVGQPVARQLVEDGFDVRLLVRDVPSARTRLGTGYDYAAGDVDDDVGVERALRGCDGVHLSVAARQRADVDRIEGEGGGRVARLAVKAGVGLLTYVSGSLVHEDYGDKIPEHRAKLGAEAAIRASGVPHVFLRPTYFVDNLPRHVQGNRAVVLGRPRPLHMVAAGDFARMVSRAFQGSGPTSS